MLYCTHPDLVKNGYFRRDVPVEAFFFFFVPLLVVLSWGSFYGMWRYFIVPRGLPLLPTFNFTTTTAVVSNNNIFDERTEFFQFA